MKTHRKLPAQRTPIPPALIVLLLGLAASGCSNSPPPGSENYSIIHSQAPPAAGPACALFQDSSGDLYGSTQLGTIFKVTAMKP